LALNVVEMLYLIGLGLGDPSDITVKGLEIIKKCDRIYLESYTSILGSGKEELERYYGREIEIADREMVEQGSDIILDGAKTLDVAFLVVGDPFGATTHTDIVLRAKELNIPTQIVHNASILNAIGACGLQLYSFGETVSIPFWTETWKPDSFYDKILENKKRGLHTLCLLDIKVKEPNLESMVMGKIVYDPPRFMSVSQAVAQILDIITAKSIEDDTPRLLDSDLCIGVARIGNETQEIVACTLAEMMSVDLGPPLHSLVIPGNLHPLELDFVSSFKRKN